jgi:ribonuclease-3
MEIQKHQARFKTLERKIGYRFRDKSLLLQAMLHSSFVNEHTGRRLQSNERLEFLGDAVLELVVSEHLVHELKNQNEGILSLKRSALVRESTLASLARSLRLHAHIVLGRGEQKENGHKRDSVLSDTFEALLGAVYRDGGIEAARGVVHRIFRPLFLRIHDIEQNYNFKNQLQEYSFKHYQATPRYRLSGHTGPDHDKRFRVCVSLKGRYITHGSGSSIKKAEQSASRNALCLIRRRSPRTRHLHATS